MAARPVAVEGSPPPPSWRIAPACAADTQGLVVSPFAHLEAGLALFLTLPPKAGCAWLKALRAAVPITDATGQTSPCAALAFTWQGLAVMGLDEATLATFSAPFTEGMLQHDRRRRLGDAGEVVVPGGPLWSGCAPGADATPTVVHAVLLLYAPTDDDARELGRVAAAALSPCAVGVARQISLSLRFDENHVGREHFGFADGLSQPVPYGDSIQTPSGAAMDKTRKDPWHGIASGDILFGHVNAHDEPAPGPLVPIDAGAPPPAGLQSRVATGAFADLGLNGSYLVIRELRQDVAKFWSSMDAAATALGDPAIDATGLAQRAVGRTIDGDPLSPGSPLPKQDGMPANSFGYLARDPHGFGCPIGSHIRRANPRDGLAARPQWGPDLLQAANNHRILRRGRKFGPDIADPRVDDGQDRGLLFMCLNTDLARQFEFVQQTWMLNRTFGVLFDETDPLLGPKGAFTIPATPLRRRLEVQTYIQLVGGDYFFLPSLPALDYLGALP